MGLSGAGPGKFPVEADLGSAAPAILRPVCRGWAVWAVFLMVPWMDQRTPEKGPPSIKGEGLSCSKTSMASQMSKPGQNSHQQRSTRWDKGGKKVTAKLRFSPEFYSKLFEKGHLVFEDPHKRLSNLIQTQPSPSRKGP